MAHSPTDTCNLALGWLSARLISSLDDTSNEAKYCVANYLPCLQATLEDREWTFCLKRAILDTVSAEAPAFGWLNAFYLPDDHIQTVQVYKTPDRNSPTIEYAIEDNLLLCDEEVVYLKYKYLVTDPSKMSYSFIQAHAALMASFMAMPLTSNPDLQMTMLHLYEDRLLRATSSDAMQGSREMLDRSSLERSRRLYVPVD